MRLRLPYWQVLMAWRAYKVHRQFSTSYRYMLIVKPTLTFLVEELGAMDPPVGWSPPPDPGATRLSRALDQLSLPSTK